MAEIALCLSGGGYRAAIFHLGVMTYLNEVRANDGTLLLDHIHTITCISGGALLGLQYIIGEKEGNGRLETFKKLYKDLIENNLGKLLVERFNEESPKGVSLIHVLADLYDKVFFHGKSFRDILGYVSWDGLHHFAVDATDFELGKPFRFQATPEIDDPDRQYRHGVIGNRQHRIPYEDAKKIRLADIMAATSCFPLVFEPIVYPDDFSEIDCQNANGISFLLMDGGLIDNHGIGSVIHAKEHLRHVNREIEMYILSDAVNAKNEREEEACPINNSFSLSCINKGLFGAFFIFMFMTVFLFKIIPVLSGVFFVLGAICLILRCLIHKFIDYVFREFERKIGFEIKNKDFLWKSNFQNVKRFILARVSTVYKMVDIIMMGNLKKNSIRNLTNEEETGDKVVLNTLPLFCMGDKWKKILRKDYMNERFLKPSRRIQKNTEKANSMNTSLWFTEEKLQQDLPKAILACGRYTICWNLLQQARKIRRNMPEQMNEVQRLLLEIEPVLRGDWERFNSNPFYNISRYIS